MSTPAANVVKIDWKEVCPWTILFQAFGLAFHVRQVFVGVIAAGLIAGAQWWIQGIAFPYANLQHDVTRHYLSYWPMAPMVDLVSPIWWAGINPDNLGRPASAPPIEALGLAHYGFYWTSVTWLGVGRSALLLVWTLLVGGLAGGIIARRAALEFTREENANLWQTTRFVFSRAIDYLSAPLLPLCGVVALGLCGVLLGCLARGIPGLLSAVTAIWIVLLAFGILAACLTFAVVAGWPMMVAAVSVNAGDGFDALSRGFGFVLDRWRYYAWCALFLTVYGNVALFIMLTAIRWGDALASESISLGLGSQQQTVWAANGANSPWHVTLCLLLTGFAYSFFWSGMSLTYLLLRKSLDNAPLKDIFVDDGSSEQDGLGALLNKNPPSEPPTLLPIIDLP